MDAKDIIQCVHNDPILKPHFRGVLPINDFTASREKMMKNSGDFIIFNTDNQGGEHWFALLRTQSTYIIFDASLLTPSIDYQPVKKYLSLPFAMDHSQLQGLNTFTCGEHCLTFVYYCISILIDNQQIVYFNYCITLNKYCDLYHTNPDIFVTNFIYVEKESIFKLKKPPLNSVMYWLHSKGFYP